MKSSSVIILFYAFVPIANPEEFRDEQKALAASLGLKGRLLIAKEGINGTFEGTAASIAEYKRILHADTRFKNMGFKESKGNGAAFRKLEVRVRNEVVTLGAGEFDIEKETAPEISADELEAMYERGEDFVVLDLRNDYEIEAGCFEKTINPQLQNFRDLPGKMDEFDSLKSTKVIAVCTGGIRCEKATCLFSRRGFTNMYQLKDGIHTYMQKYPGRRFKGTLFVFDNRMVTPVVETPTREIIGRCAFCGSPSEEYYSDDTVRPSKKVICCSECILSHQELRTCASSFDA